MQTSSSFIAYTDGSCVKKNPKDSTGIGGWGFTMCGSSDPCKSFDRWGGDPDTTNNRMELMAPIELLKVFNTFPDKSTLTIYSDSKYVVTGITEWIKGWKKRNWVNSQKMPVLNKDLWVEFDELVTTSKHKIHFKWVKGHSGNVGNDRADELSNMYRYNGCVETMKCAMMKR